LGLCPSPRHGAIDICLQLAGLSAHYGTVVDPDANDTSAVVISQPYGVVLGIGPWNAPHLGAFQDDCVSSSEREQTGAHAECMWSVPGSNTQHHAIAYSTAETGVPPVMFGVEYNGAIDICLQLAGLSAQCHNAPTGRLAADRYRWHRCIRLQT
jgi:hypothetical protein